MDVERTIEFILQHQAHFAAEMEQLKEQLKERHKEFAFELDQLKERHKELSGSVEGLQSAVAALQVVMHAQQGQISQILAITQALADSQRHTDERLNALIKVVDDLVRRNGGRQ